MIQIKPTTDNELVASLNEEVQQLHHQMHPHIFKPFDLHQVAEALRIILAKDNCHAFVAWKDARAVGYMILLVNDSGDSAFQYNARSVHVDQVGVLSHHRRSGVGEALMQKAEQLARDLNACRLDLDHWATNTNAAAFFRKHGFELCREKLWKLF